MPQAVVPNKIGRQICYVVIHLSKNGQLSAVFFQPSSIHCVKAHVSKSSGGSRTNLDVLEKKAPNLNSSCPVHCWNNVESPSWISSSSAFSVLYGILSYSLHMIGGTSETNINIIQSLQGQALRAG